MQNELNEVESLLKELLKISPLQHEDQKRLDKKFRLEFSYNSNHIEGNTLTYGETELLILFDDTKGNHTLREFEEMKSHDIAFLKINDWAKEERELTETDIKELNKIILVRDFWKEAITEDNQPTRRKITVGNYKEYPNSVRLENGEMFEYASVIDTPIKMRELMDWYKTEGKDFHPVVLAALFHYKLVTIHPFDDGNGRLSRLLLNYILLKNNYPPIVIKSTDKKNYLSALHKADLGDLEEFSKYILKQQIWSLELSIKAAKGENIDEPNDWEKKLAQMKMEVFNHSEKAEELNQDSFNRVNEESISHLFSELDNALKNIEILFAEAKYFISSGNNKAFQSDNFSNSYSFLYDNSKHSISKVSIYCKFNDLINLEKVVKISSEEIKIEFNKFNYTVRINGKMKLVKLYNQNLDDKEIDKVINLIGADLIQKIEEAQI